MVTQVLAPATLSAGQRIYAVGDVHGCIDELSEMHRLIAADLARRPIGAATLIHLGDYIDRGPDSAGVIARLLGPVIPGVRVINLMGNHEAMLLEALEGGRGAAGHWLDNGGVAALESWRVPPRLSAKEWVRVIPPAHIAFMRNLALNNAADGYFFVHAGVRPGVALAAQSRHDMLWIREPFLSHTGTLERVIVHGHTPEEPRPVIRPHRIGLDTGAVLGGALTCAVLEGDRMGFLTV